MLIMNEIEQVVLVNRNGDDILNRDGSIRTMEKIEAHKKGQRHRAVSVFIFNNCQLIIQKRAKDKYHSQEKWSNTCCTHPRPGESPLSAARRRLFEEMGLECPIKEIFTFSYYVEMNDGMIENEFDHVFIGFSGINPVHDPAEVSEWKWISVEKVCEDLKINPDKYSSWFSRCFQKVLNELEKNIEDKRFNF